MKSGVDMAKLQTFKELVKSKGMTQVELAEKVGCSTRVISYWIKGRNVPSLKEAYYLACALGVSLEDLAIIFLNNQNGGKGNGQQQNQEVL